MVIKEDEFKIYWENQNFMELKFKPDGGDEILVIKVEENGKLSDIIDEIKNICRKFFNSKLEEVASEMLEGE